MIHSILHDGIGNNAHDPPYIAGWNKVGGRGGKRMGDMDAYVWIELKV